MQKSHEKYILGGGPAGLIAAFYNPEYQIIDKNPMGQLNLPFVPGPRILKVDEYSKKFLDRLGMEYSTKYIYVGYSPDGVIVEEEASQKFKEDYSQITRGTTKIEDSFLSSGENEIEVFITKTGEDLYYKVFETLTQLLEHRIINKNVEFLSTKRQLLGWEGITTPYKHIISTLNINILTKLLGLEPLNLVALKKHFVQCSYNNERDIEDSQKFHYVYSTDGTYTRKTYFKDYIVYETCEPAEHPEPDITFHGNKIIKALNNIPIQINNSIDFRNIQGIDLVGRFAQWNHSIKANEIIARYER